MSRKVMFLLAVLFLAVLVIFSSCLDGLQAVFRNKDGSMTVLVRYTVSKALFAMSEDTSPDDLDMSELDDELLDIEDLRAQLPPEIALKSDIIDTEMDYGVRFELTVPEGYVPDSDVPLIPRIKGGKAEIRLLSVNDSEDEEVQDPQMEAMTNAFFSSAKYKIVMSKSVFDNLNQVILARDGESANIEFEDIGDSYLIDLSFLLLMEENPGILIFLAL